MKAKHKYKNHGRVAYQVCEEKLKSQNQKDLNN